MAPLQVAVLYGGKSTEHEVSIHSAQTVCRVLAEKPQAYTVYPIFIDKQGFWFLQKACGPHQASDKPITPVIAQAANLLAFDGSWKTKIDVFFPVVHGTNCEDGTLQGFLETLDVPYVGCGVLPSAIGMDKVVTKLLAQCAGVPVLPFFPIHKNIPYNTYFLKTWVEKQGLPVFVKPVRLGSSVGVRKVKTLDELKPAIDFALSFDTDVMVEKGVDHAREIFCALYGQGENVKSSACGELRMLAGEFFDYNAKYLVEGGCETKVPADIPADIAEKMRADSVAVFHALNGSGLARVDFLMDKNGAYYFSEINTIPGMSETSLYPQLFEACGEKYPQILDGLIEQAQEIYKCKKTLSLNR